MSVSEDETDVQPLLQMSRMSEDPFYTIRDEVKAQSEQIKVRHEKFQDLVRNVDTSSNAEFQELRKGLVKDVRVVDRKLKGLREAVEVVEKNRSKFPHIKDAELQSRKLFVDTTQLVINDVKVGLEAPPVRRKMESDTMKAQRTSFEMTATTAASAPGVGNTGIGKNGVSSTRTGSTENGNNAYRSALESENDHFIKDNRQTQELMLREQDKNLNTLGRAVDSLGVMARDINVELKEQDKLLDALGNEVDDNRTRLDTVMTSLQKLLKAKDGCQVWTIVILTLILILLSKLIPSL